MLLYNSLIVFFAIILRRITNRGIINDWTINELLDKRMLYSI